MIRGVRGRARARDRRLVKSRMERVVKAVTMMMRRRKRKKAASCELQYCRNTSIHRHKSCMSKRQISQEDLAIQA
jgi:hypothetical protein